MLVLTRKLGQKIIIGDRIVITIVKVDDFRVQIGIEAPREIPVFRKEVIDKIGDMNKQAMRSVPDDTRHLAIRLRNWISRVVMHH